MNDVRASVCKPRASRAFPRYDGTSFASIITESSGEHLVMRGIKLERVGERCNSGAGSGDGERDVGGVSGRMIDEELLSS